MRILSGPRSCLFPTRLHRLNPRCYHHSLLLPSHRTLSGSTTSNHPGRLYHPPRRGWRRLSTTPRNTNSTVSPITIPCTSFRATRLTTTPGGIARWRNGDTTPTTPLFHRGYMGSRGKALVSSMISFISGRVCSRSNGFGPGASAYASASVVASRRLRFRHGVCVRGGCRSSSYPSCSTTSTAMLRPVKPHLLESLFVRKIRYLYEFSQRNMACYKSCSPLLALLLSN